MINDDIWLYNENHNQSNSMNIRSKNLRGNKREKGNKNKWKKKLSILKAQNNAKKPERKKKTDR